MTQIAGTRVEVWLLEETGITLARPLHDRHPTLGVRDLCHLVSCRRRGISAFMTFGQALDTVTGWHLTRGPQ